MYIHVIYIYICVYVCIRVPLSPLTSLVPVSPPFMGTLLTFYRWRAVVVGILTIFFLSFFFSRFSFFFFFKFSLAAPSRTTAVPTPRPFFDTPRPWCMKIIPPVGNVPHGFLTDDCLHLSRYRSQLDRGETRE